MPETSQLARREAPAASGNGCGAIGFALFGAPSPSGLRRAAGASAPQAGHAEGKLLFDIPSRARRGGAMTHAILLFASAARLLWDATLNSSQSEASMTDPAALAEIEKRIQIVEDNLRQLQEQAAAYSGAADEERNAERIADQEAKLEALLKQREALMGKV